MSSFISSDSKKRTRSDSDVGQNDRIKMNRTENYIKPLGDVFYQARSENRLAQSLQIISDVSPAARVISSLKLKKSAPCPSPEQIELEDKMDIDSDNDISTAFNQSNLIRKTHQEIKLPPITSAPSIDEILLKLNRLGVNDSDDKIIEQTQNRVRNGRY